MRYDSYRYITPPRAENAVMPDLLHFYEKRGWWAQVKKNGTNSIIYVPPKSEGRPFAKTRHVGDPDHRAWAFTEASIAVFCGLQDDQWHVFNAELMHSKGNGIHDTNYVHDVLVWRGNHLIGKNFEQRQRLLGEIFGITLRKGPDSHFVVDSNTWVAKNHPGSFRDLFHCLKDEDEGLVLKNPEGILTIKNNTSWLVKCRRPHANYGF